MRSGSRSGAGRGRKIAYRDLSFPEIVQVPPILIGMEVIRHGTIAGPLTDDQDEVLWKMLSDMRDRFKNGKLSVAQLFQLGQAWRGSVDFLGWGGLAPSLDPSLRGPLAYFAGLRYRKLDRPVDADRFFRQAAADAGDDAALRRLAARELAASK